MTTTLRLTSSVSTRMTGSCAATDDKAAMAHKAPNAKRARLWLINTFIRSTPEPQSEFLSESNILRTPATTTLAMDCGESALFSRNPAHLRTNVWDTRPSKDPHPIYHGVDEESRRTCSDAKERVVNKAMPVIK